MICTPTGKPEGRPVSHRTLYRFWRRQCDRGVIPVVTNRARMDVSKSYDRWNHMREKRSGMAKWSDRHCRA